ncbi:MAG: hypothetical protein H6867_06615 [Rhodospirillales bacterium]|nr:hypothetical protein [Rhodospirillales bacterium]MCB9995221.1 hypothetical protein [Rhodospirillales bacterium]
MRRFYLASAVILLSAVSQDAGAQNRSAQKQFQPFLTRGETTWSISGGLRNNKTTFRSASDITGTVTPNIFIEDSYDDVSFIEAKANVRHIEPADILFIKGGIHADAEIRGGIIVDGYSQISAFAGDDRTLEANRQATNQLKGDAIGAQVSLGYQINLTGTPGYRAQKIMNTPTPRTAKGRMKKHRALQKALQSSGPYISVTPLVGYGIDQQNYVIEEGFEIIPDFEDTVFKADYITNWRGPFFGAEAEIKNKKHMMRVRSQYHDLSYDAVLTDHIGNSTWEQEADGEGITLNAEYAYALGEDYALTFEGFFQRRTTDEGTQVDSFQGADPVTVKLYELDDESHALRMGVRYNWD